MTNFDNQPASEADIAEQQEAQRSGLAFLLYRAPPGRQQIALLQLGPGPLTIGRRQSNDVSLDWDPNVSRVHAQLEPVGGEWALIDEGLSRNGTMLNGRPLAGRQRLHDGDVVTVGMTELLYRAPPDTTISTTASPPERPPVDLTETQRRILMALCRPCLDPNILEPPATNRQIANEVSLSVDSIKSHLRALSAKFELGELPQNEKRIKLVGEALRRGVVPAGRAQPRRRST